MLSKKKKKKIEYLQARFDRFDCIMNNALLMLNTLSQEEMHEKLDILQERSDDALEKIDVTVQMVSKFFQKLYQERGKRPTARRRLVIDLHRHSGVLEIFQQE